MDTRSMLRGAGKNSPTNGLARLRKKRHALRFTAGFACHPTFVRQTLLRRHSPMASRSRPVTHLRSVRGKILAAYASPYAPSQMSSG
jgi:hypothetical protein